VRGFVAHYPVIFYSVYIPTRAVSALLKITLSAAIYSSFLYPSKCQSPSDFKGSISGLFNRRAYLSLNQKERRLIGALFNVS
jgi:hypothetical protein